MEVWVEIAEARCATAKFDEAVSGIHEAIRHGLRDVGRLRGNAILAPLQEREDFLQLLSDLRPAVDTRGR